MLGPFGRRAEPALGPRSESLFHCPVRNADVRWEEKGAFSPAAIVREGKLHLLYEAREAGGPHRDCARIGLAVSDDGIVFERREAPVLHPDDDFMTGYEWDGGCADPRVVEREDGTYVMTYTAFDGAISRLAVASSRDLVRWTKHGLAFGKAGAGRFKERRSKSGVILTSLDGAGRLVAQRLAGKYWMYWGDSEVLAASSDNLVDWSPLERSQAPADREGSFKVVLGPRRGRFDSGRVEPGPPALLTTAGILLLYDGSNDRTTGDPSLPDGAVSGGQVLLDPEDPSAVIARAKAPFIRPEAQLAKAGPGVVAFLRGLVFFRGRWLLYYGSAESTIGVAERRP